MRWIFYNVLSVILFFLNQEQCHKQMQWDQRFPVEVCYRNFKAVEQPEQQSPDAKICSPNTESRAADTQNSAPGTQLRTPAEAWLHVADVGPWAADSLGLPAVLLAGPKSTPTSQLPPLSSSLGQIEKIRQKDGTDACLWRYQRWGDAWHCQKCRHGGNIHPAVTWCIRFSIRDITRIHLI